MYGNHFFTFLYRTCRLSSIWVENGAHFGRFATKAWRISKKWRRVTRGLLVRRPAKGGRAGGQPGPRFPGNPLFSPSPRPPVSSRVGWNSRIFISISFSIRFPLYGIIPFPFSFIFPSGFSFLFSLSNIIHFPIPSTLSVSMCFSIPISFSRYVPLAMFFYIWFTIPFYCQWSFPFSFIWQFLFRHIVDVMISRGPPPGPQKCPQNGSWLGERWFPHVFSGLHLALRFKWKSRKMVISGCKMGPKRCTRRKFPENVNPYMR